MKRGEIVILGWGSLVWNPGELPIIVEKNKDLWQMGGPSLPLEFSRTSENGRLTLVIDRSVPKRVPTRFAISSRENLLDAAADLCAREKTKFTYIGHLDRRTDPPADEDPIPYGILRDWLNHTPFQGMVWTALPPKGKISDLEAAEKHLRGLSPREQREAYKYIKLAPTEVDTPFRAALLQLLTAISE